MKKENSNQQNKERTNEGNETKIYLTGDDTLQTPEEHRHDESINPEKNDQISIPDRDWRHSNPHPADVRNIISTNEQNEENAGNE